MPQVVQNQDGRYFIDQGGGVMQPVTETQARIADKAMRMGALASTGDAALQSAANLASGAVNVANRITGQEPDPYWQDKLAQGQDYSEALQAVNPVGETVGAAVPQVAGGIAAAAAAPEGLLGAGIVGGVEALMGAAANPENPGTGALIGGLAGAAGQALPGAIRAGYGRGRDALGGLPFGRGNPLREVPLNPGGYGAGERAPLDLLDEVRAAPSPPSASSNPPDLSTPLRQPGQPSPAAAAAPRTGTATDRVVSTIERAADAPPEGEVANMLALQGMASPEELYARGVPVSKGQEQLLRATTRGGEAELNAAQRQLAREEMYLSDPSLGGEGRAIREAQKGSALNFIARQLDIPNGATVTEDMLSTTIGDLGHKFDDIAEMVGRVPITKEVNNELDEVLKYTLGKHKGLVTDLVQQVRDRAELNGGSLTGQDWQAIRTQIGKLETRGMKSGDIGMITDAGELMQTLTKTMEGQLDDATRAELVKLRHQYRIAQTLTKPGVRDVDGGINAGAFYRNWKQGQSKKAAGKDEVGRFMNTINTLTQKRVPNSGTADRLLMNAKSAALGAGKALPYGIGALIGGFGL